MLKNVNSGSGHDIFVVLGTHVRESVDSQLRFATSMQFFHEHQRCLF